MIGRLPRPPNPLFGRDADLNRAAELLLRDDVPLVTITGPGGSGKTRFAIALAHKVAEQFEDGVYYVELDGVSTPEEVAPAIADALVTPRDATPEPGSGSRATTMTIAKTIAQASDRSPASLAAGIGDRRCLVVLDTFDHVLEASPVVSTLVGDCPGLKLVATSREALRIQNEWDYSLAPFPVPDLARHLEHLSADQVAPLVGRQPAVALLLARGQAAHPGVHVTADNMHALAAICAALDGLPLALDLAAVCLTEVSPEEVAERLADDPLAELGGRAADRAARHQNLRSNFAWSYDRLTMSERSTFRRLSVFTDGFTLEAVEAVLGEADALSAVATLLYKNLLVTATAPDDEPRWAMLNTVRAFARAELVRWGEADDAWAALAAWSRALDDRAVASQIEELDPQRPPPDTPEVAGFATRPSPGEDVAALSPKEREVALLLARGHTYREIAASLVVTMKTVEKHVGNILKKLGLENRLQVAVWVGARGLADDGDAGEQD